MDSNKIKGLAFGACDALRAEVGARVKAVLTEGSAERLDEPEKVCALEASIADRGLDAVVESTAYTWFNRLCALRFMDARGYTPVPAVTPRVGATQPAVLADAAQGVFDPEYGFSRLVRDRVQSVLAGGSGSGVNRTEAAYGVLLQAVCAHYAEAMPYLFGEATASSLAMPQGLLAEDSILRRIVEDMDDDACASVEVLGWLYQFYVAERKDEFNASGRKAAADDIAPATQLFTPDWIVKYLVENSLGRLWMLNNPGSLLAEKMNYYIAPEGETEDFIEVYSPEELTLCDPACGSGHILVYAFDVLYEIYQEEGYLPEDIPALILQKNLFGMEIDERAAEIAKFALEMKAREKDLGFFEKHIDANVTVLETVTFEPGALAGAGPIAGATELLDAFAHMTEVGSLYVPAPGDMAAVDNAIVNFSEDDLFGANALRKLHMMRDVLKALSRRVDCMVANPPYLTSGKFDAWLSDWTKTHYPNEKSDLCTCFIKRSFSLTNNGGYSSMITMQSWMFIPSYKKLRKEITTAKQILGMAHIGTRGFETIGGEVVSTSATIICNDMGPATGFFVRLADFDDARKKNDALKEVCLKGAANSGIAYLHDANFFMETPDNKIAYRLTKTIVGALSERRLSNALTTREGMSTADNDTFLRLWFEPAIGSCFLPSKNNELTSRKWRGYQKGGEFRRWYGNNDYVVNWENDGYAIKHNFDQKTGRLRSHNFNGEFAGREGLTWSTISSELHVRYCPSGFLFDSTGAMGFASSREILAAFLAFMNTTTAATILNCLSEALHLKFSDIAQLPSVESIFKDSEGLVSDCIALSRTDWDSFETSWDFECHPLAPSAHEHTEQLSCAMNSDVRAASVSLISELFRRWSADCDERFNQLKANEEELNRIFAHIYGMEGEVPIEVPDDKVSVRRADLVRDVKSLVSYGVGCIMGRYSTFAPGLILADAKQTVDDFRAKVPDAGFLPDEDAIVPVLDGEWFGDDIVAQFRKWLEVTYGADTLADNVRFIEDALGKDLRRYFVKDFYKDHCATYQVTGSGKRPIYWMFASPKGGFQALAYMHRYTPSAVGLILTKYLREYTEKLNATIGQLDQSERAADNRQADKYRAVVRELSDWERDVIYPLANERVDIDLDDGVKKNYNKFPRALARVAGLSTWK